MNKLFNNSVYILYIKRFIDILCSGIALLVLLPIMAIIAVLIRTKLGSPVLFTQDRPGKSEKIFKI